MICIFNKRGLREAYEWLDLLRSCGLKSSNQTIKDVKGAIRSYNKRPASPHIVGNRGDEWVEVIILPDHITSLKQAGDYFHDYIEELYTPASYSPTGQKFTCDYLIRRRNDGRFVCYHTVAIDV